MLNDVVVKEGIPETENLFKQAKVSVCVEKQEEPLSILMSQKEQIEVEVQQEDVITAPVSGGDKVGRITYKLNDSEIASYPIVVAKDMKKKDFAWIFTEIIEMYALR